MSDRILTDAELGEFAKLNEARTQEEWTASDDGEWIWFPLGGMHVFSAAAVQNASFVTACSIMVPRMLETIRQQRELLKDALEVADHAPGCSGGIRTSPRGSDGEYPYPCKCGYVEWLEKVKEVTA